MEIELSEPEFALFQALMLQVAGIQLGDGKRALVSSRLAGRLRTRGLSSYRDYFALISNGSDAAERQTAVDLLTTNETHFFREQKHFDFLRERLLQLPRSAAPFRVWSAACSSGEEPYSIAMLLAECLPGRAWEILASDLSSRMLVQARQGHYPLSRARQIPERYLKRHCLRGLGPEDGTLLIDDELRRRVEFRAVNLKDPLPEVGIFDVIFLRNVMFYFDSDTKVSVLARLTERLRPQGYLLIGHSEALTGTHRQLRQLMPAIYQKRSA